MFDHVEHGVERLQVGHLDVATLHGQTVRDFVVLGLGELHGWIFQSKNAPCLVLTRPSFGPESDSLARLPGTQKRLQHLATVYPVVDHAAKLQTSANPLILNTL